MTEAISVFKKGSDEYFKLMMVAAILESRSPNGYKYKVDETYFDFGQGWKWTTIICDGDSDDEHSWGRYQALCPAEQERILESDGNLEELKAIAEEVLSDKYCPDRIRG